MLKKTKMVKGKKLKGKSKLERARELLGDLNKKFDGKGGDINYLPSGKSVWRFLPVETADGDFFKQISMHFKMGANGENIRCPTDVGRKCPIDAKGAKISDKKKRAKYFPRKQVALVAVQVAPQREHVPKIIIVPMKVFKEVLNYYVDVDEYGPILDLREGRDVVVMRTGELLETDYKVSLRDVDKSIKLKESIMDKTPDLDEKFGPDAYWSAEKIVAVLEGVEYEDDEDKEEEEDAEDEDTDDEDEDLEEGRKAVARRKAKAKAKRPKDEDEDEDEEEDEEEESDEDEDEDVDEDGDEGEDEDDDSDDDDEPPRKAKKKLAAKKRAPKDEDEDADEEEESDEDDIDDLDEEAVDEDEDEDEAPKRKLKKGKALAKRR